MRTKVMAAVLALTVVLGGCGADAAEPGPSGAVGTVRLAINPWVGYEANAAVLAYLLKEELGYQVTTTKLDESSSWGKFATGEIDVVMENWDHPELRKEFIQQKRVALSAGLTGNKGVIGWYVPQWMADRYPDITDWRNLNKYAHLFKTDKSGDVGQFLAGDPTYVTNDETLVRNLHLDYKVVYAGSEEALIRAAKDATKNRRPLLMYLYEPQWVFSQIELARVNLPPYAIGCDAVPAKVACDYPPYLLDKIVSKKFADTGGKAYELVRNFTWTNDQQNAVASDIASKGMSAEQAAKKWVEANKIVWKDWLPK